MKLPPRPTISSHRTDLGTLGPEHRSPGVSSEDPVVPIQITGTFTVFGTRTREIDLTPVLGLALILFVVYLVGANS